MTVSIEGRNFARTILYSVFKYCITYHLQHLAILVTTSSIFLSPVSFRVRAISNITSVISTQSLPIPSRCETHYRHDHLPLACQRYPLRHFLSVTGPLDAYLNLQVCNNLPKTCPDILRTSVLPSSNPSTIALSSTHRT